MRKGFSLVEMLVYVSILAFMLILITQVVISVAKNDRIIKSTRAVESSAAMALERITREIRKATSTNITSSALGIHPGKLVLNGSPNIEFYLSNGRIYLKENGVDQGPLTASTTRITNLIFHRYESSGSTQYLEAEAAALISPMTITSSNDASGGSYIFSPQTDAGQATFSFSVPLSGEYLIWGRVLSPISNADSFFVSVDGGTEDIYDTAEDAWSPYWQWTKVNGRGGTGVPLTVNPRIFQLSAGNHTVRFRVRESNTNLDQIMITRISSTDTEGIRIELTLESGTSTHYRSETFYSSATLR